MKRDLLHGQRPFSSVVVHPVVGDSSELPAAVVLIVDVVRHVLQVLHVSSEDAKAGDPGDPFTDALWTQKEFVGT